MTIYFIAIKSILKVSKIYCLAKNGMQIYPIYLAMHTSMEENSSRIDISFFKATNIS